MTTSTSKMRQLVDWSAALWAGVIAGSVFFLLLVFVTPIFAGGNAWVVIRLLASIGLGADILAPPATFDLTALIVALISNFVLSIGFALLIAYVLHRWGLIMGIVGGALLGLAIYAINFYTLTFFFPWFFAMRSWPIVISHLIFGALAGGIYESLEVEEFIPVENE